MFVPLGQDLLSLDQATQLGVIGSAPKYKLAALHLLQSFALQTGVGQLTIMSTPNPDLLLWSIQAGKPLGLPLSNLRLAPYGQLRAKQKLFLALVEGELAALAGTATKWYQRLLRYESNTVFTGTHEAAALLHHKHHPF
jgi:hypothetical protein